METSKKSYMNLAVKWAVIYTITSIVIVYAMQLTGVDQTTSPLRFLTYIPLIGFMLLTQKEYRDQLGGYMTFGEGYVAGIVYSAVVGVLAGIFIYIYFSFLSPQVWEQVLASSREKMEEGKNLSSDQIDKALSITAKYGIIIGAVAAIFTTPIMGAMISLIGAAIFKKVRTVADIENETTSYPDSAV